MSLKNNLNTDVLAASSTCRKKIQVQNIFLYLYIYVLRITPEIHSYNLFKVIMKNKLFKKEISSHKSFSIY